MNNLILPGSERTPQCDLLSSGDLSFRGVSTPEDAADFYSNIMEWISDYYRDPSRKTEVTISLRNLNSTSVSMLTKMFYFLNKLQACGKTQVRCHWYYEDKDTEILSCINQIKEFADLIDFRVQATDDVMQSRAS